MFGEDWTHDPVHVMDGEWYFWDESWAESHGPFNTERLARKALMEYCIEYLGEEVDRKDYDL